MTFLDEEILNFVSEARPPLIPIDAPLNLPKDRQTVQDRPGEHLRDCDRELLQRGIRFFPITLGPTRILTERGLALKQNLGRLNIRLWSTILPRHKIHRQHQNRLGLLTGLRHLGLRGLKKAATSDELDTATTALVDRWSLLGQGTMLGGKTGILIPAVEEKSKKLKTLRVRAAR